MADARFFIRSSAITLADIASLSGATLKGSPDILIHDVAPLDSAQEGCVSFLDNTKYLDQFTSSRASAAFVRDKFAPRAPHDMALLISDDPYRAFALTSQYFYPAAQATGDICASAHISARAMLGNDVTVGHGAVIEDGAEIGSHVSIGHGCVIGRGVRIGDGSQIGPLCSISHALIGKRVIVHGGAHIGQDGFGFAMGRAGHVKVPQLGRVVIEDDVEIGAGTCIDRGAGPDTYIGAGTKIDNLVQIGHNVRLGRGCIVVSQVGISGSTVIGDGVVIGGQAGIAGHLTIGSGAMLAARTGVTANLEPAKTYGGTPAMPIKDWHRQVVALHRLIKPRRQEES